MMLTKQGIDISFAQGLDTKTDPKRVQMGKFLELQNSVFNKGGLLQKRNGYGLLSSLPDTSYSYLTTFGGNLTAIGKNIAAYNSAAMTWVQKGHIQPLSVDTLPVIRNNLNQNAADTAVAPSGVACTAYIETNGTVSTNKYVVFDSTTGQNLSAPAVIPVSSGTVSGGMRVFVLTSHFIIVFTNANSLQYIAISILDPSSVSANANIAAAYVPAATISWDGVVASDRLFIAYNTTSGGQQVDVTYLTPAFTVAPARAFAARKADMMSVCADTEGTSPVIYVSFYRTDTQLAATAAVDFNLNQILAPTTVVSGATFVNITSSAQGGGAVIFFENPNVYSFDASIATNAIYSRSITVGGVVGTLTNLIRSLGIASKSFIVDRIIYLLGAFQSTYQPGYFLVNGSTSTAAAPVVAAKLAYQNGGGYLTTGLPSISVNGHTARFNYLFKDLIQAVNKNTNVVSGTQTAGIYSQTGINLATITIGTQTLVGAEIGSDLQLTGGFLWMYDGYLPVEHNFFLWPDTDQATPADTAAWTATSTVTPTGTFASGATTVVVSSASGISVGMTIADTSNAAYIPAGTQVVGISGTTLTISKATTHVAAGDNLSIQGNIAAEPDGATTTNAYYYQITYEWTDNQGNAYRSAPSIPIPVTTSGAGTAGVITVNVPTLRVTMKTANPVKIVIYRWSVAQQNYYQVTSITSPVLNDTTIDSVSFVDTLPDASILGNNLIYTTGGVLEDVNAPASNAMTLFDSRLWLIDAEDQNLLWYSKQVIEATPVEMSDLLTLYVPPTTGTGQSTGPSRTLFPMDDKLIIGKENAFVYVNGRGPDNTGSNSQYSDPIFITSVVGCTNQKSMILMPKGIMFQSNKGIWLLDRGLNTSYIGAPVEDFTQGATVLSAVTVPETNQVRFTLDTGVTLMYDYFYDQWGTFFGVPCVSSCIFEDLHTFINDLGLAYQETSGSYLDGGNPVLMRFRTGPIRLGDLQNYQRAYFFYILGSYISPHKLYVSMNYDYDTNPSQSVLITPTNYSTPFGSGASQSPFGQGTPFGGPPALESWRVFLERQRCMAFGITVQEVYDATMGAPAGAGLTISGLNVICAFKKAFRPQANVNSAG